MIKEHKIIVVLLAVIVILTFLFILMPSYNIIITENVVREVALYQSGTGNIYHMANETVTTTNIITICESVA